MKEFLLGFTLLVVLVVSIFGFRGQTSTKPPLEIFPDMDRQARYKPQGENAFFPDGMNDRPVLANTVPHITEEQRLYPWTAPRDAFVEDDYFSTGTTGPEQFGDGMPEDIDVDAAFMARGRERYNIYCSVCHGVTGDGDGITRQYGMIAVPSYHQERLRDMPDGEIFHVITHGRNTMMPYRMKLRVADRWAVVLYVRALQRSVTATMEDVPEEERENLQQ